MLYDIWAMFLCFIDGHRWWVMGSIADPYPCGTVFCPRCLKRAKYQPYLADIANRKALSRVTGDREEAERPSATCPSSLRSPEPSKDVSAHPGDGQAQGGGR
jgi:hypothetical protein